MRCSTGFHRSQSVAFQQPQPQPCWLQGVGYDAGPWLSGEMRDVDDLKQRLIDVWDSLEQSVIDDAIDQWRSRLRACYVSVRKGNISNSLCNLHLNFVINWHFVCHFWSWMHCFNMKMSLFVTTVISQGCVATDLKCGGQCNNHFVANLLPNSTVKKIWNSVNICQSYGQKHSGPFFDSQCIYDVIGHHRHAIDSLQVTTQLLLRKSCKLCVSVARVCQRQLGFLVIFPAIWLFFVYN